jgi:hypothetical protein
MERNAFARAWRVALLPALCLPVCAEAALDSPVTLDLQAAPLSRLLPQVATACGIKMEPTGDTASDVLLVHVKDVTVSELMKRIAWADGAEWTQLDGVYRLGRFASLDRKQRDEAIAARVKAVQQMLDAYDQRSNPPDWLEKFGCAVLRAIDLSAALELPPGGRVVLSTAPTPYQVGMPSGVLRPIREFWSHVEPELAAGRALSFAGAVMRGKLTGKPLAKALLAISPGMLFGPSPEDALDLNLVLADSDGAVLFCGGVHLIFPSTAGEGKPDVSIADDIPLEIGSDARAFAQEIHAVQKAVTAGTQLLGPETDYSLSTLRAGVGVPALDAEWRSRLLHPETTDPLVWTASAAFTCSAEALNVNMVACLPDSILVPSAEFLCSQRTVRALLDEAQTKWRMKAVREKDWLCLRPMDQAHARDWRTDRQALARAAAALDAKGVLDLDEKADFAMAQPLGPGDGLDLAVLRCFNPAITPAGAGAGELAAQLACRYYGNAMPGIRSRILDGDLLTLAELSEAQKAILVAMMGNAIAVPRADPKPTSPGEIPEPPEAPAGGRGYISLSPSRGNEGLPIIGVCTWDLRSLWDESTEWLAGPWQRDARIGGDRFGGREVIASNGRSCARAAVHIADIANQQNQDASDTENPTSQPIVLELYVPAEGDAVGIYVKFNHYSWFLANLRDHRVDPNAKPVRASELPEDYRKEMDFFHLGG